MAPLSFTCPNTGRQSLTRVETDTASLATAWKKTLKIECPHCGEVHRVAVREAYIASAIQDGTVPIMTDRLPHNAPRPAPKGFFPRRPKAPSRLP